MIVPEEYTQTGILPIYVAISQDFNAVIKPEMFNQSGVFSQSEGRHKDHEIVSADEATLPLVCRSRIDFYTENSGTYDINADTEYAPEFAPLPALSNTIKSLASMECSSTETANWKKRSRWTRRKPRWRRCSSS
jgi:hypothetical protein